MELQQYIIVIKKKKKGGGLGESKYDVWETMALWLSDHLFVIYLFIVRTYPLF